MHYYEGICLIRELGNKPENAGLFPHVRGQGSLDLEFESDGMIT